VFVHLEYEELTLSIAGLGKEEEEKKEDPKNRMFPFHEKGKIEKRERERASYDTSN